METISRYHEKDSFKTPIKCSYCYDEQDIIEDNLIIVISETNDPLQRNIHSLCVKCNHSTKVPDCPDMVFERISKKKHIYYFKWFCYNCSAVTFVNESDITVFCVTNCIICLKCDKCNHNISRFCNLYDISRCSRRSIF